MAMKGMVERDCGGANALMNLTQQLELTVTQNSNFQGSKHSVANSSQLYKDHKNNMAPTTFSMHDLLAEMQQLPSQQQQRFSRPLFKESQPLDNPIHTCDWLEEFHHHPILIEHSTLDLDTGHLDEEKHFPTHNLPHHLPLYHHSDYHLPFHLHEQQQHLPNLHLNQNFQFFERFPNDDIELNVLDNDTNFIYHYDGVNDLYLGDDFVQAKKSSLTSSAFEKCNSEQQQADITESNNITFNNNSFKTDEKCDDVWSTMQNGWKHLVKNYCPSWENEFWTGLDDEEDDHFYKTYKFDETNPLLSNKSFTDAGDVPGDDVDAFSEGVKRLKEGDVANAVLFLEAAVHRHPEDSEAWFHLGTAQADNEQESMAIAAFNKCLDLNPENLKALMSLAVGYTNESLPHKACKCLRDWLARHHKYSSLIGQKNNDEIAKSSYKSHTELLDLFLEAVHMSTNRIDPDVQIGMGVLFNLTGEYNKAVDCFKTALQVAPEDSMLWNKLGATLANGQMSEQAITAYHQALNLRPGYVRTRFNLGVACVNLGAYREAVEHFLSALTLKDQTKGPKTASNDNNIWSSLRMALSLLGSTDLLDSCDKHDLQFLNAHFKLN